MLLIGGSRQNRKLIVVHEGNVGTIADGPSIFIALQEQLGLKLETARGPVELLVIDSVSKLPDN